MGYSSTNLKEYKKRANYNGAPLHRVKKDEKASDTQKEGTGEEAPPAQDTQVAPKPKFKRVQIRKPKKVYLQDEYVDDPENIDWATRINRIEEQYRMIEERLDNCCQAVQSLLEIG